MSEEMKKPEEPKGPHMTEIPIETEPDGKSVQDKKRQKFYIWLVSIGGYLISALLVPLTFRMLFPNPDAQAIEVGLIVILLAINLIIWVPVTLIAFRIHKRAGFSSAMIFLVTAIVVSSLLTRGCFGM